MKMNVAQVLVTYSAGVLGKIPKLSTVFKGRSNNFGEPVSEAALYFPSYRDFCRVLAKVSYVLGCDEAEDLPEEEKEPITIQDLEEMTLRLGVDSCDEGIVVY